MKRVIFDIVLFLSAFIFPWYFVVLLLLVGIFVFVSFYEFIFVSVIIYSLYSVPSDKIISSPIFFSLMIIFSYTLIQIIRNNIILYKNEI